MEESHIDWNDLWNRKKERSSKQFPKEKKSPEEAKKNALLYLKGHGHGENMEELLQSLPLSPEIRVLDIGPVRLQYGPPHGTTGCAYHCNRTG